MSGIKQITDEVKKAVSKSVEPMKQMSSQAKSMASNSSASVNAMKQQIKSYNGSISDTTKQQEYLISKIAELKEKLNSGGAKNSKDELKYEKLSNTLSVVRNQITDLEEKLKGLNLQLSQQNYYPTPEKELEKTKQQIKQTENLIQKLNLKASNISLDMDNISGVNISSTEIKKAEAEIEQLENKLKKLQSVNSDKGKENNVLKNLKKHLPDISKKVDNVKDKIKTLTKTINTVGSNTSKSFGKGLKSLKSFALRIVGIEAAMTGVSKAASAYLSFDEELSKSFQNSWNMLGSLLAPALELVASLFAKATSYAAYFVKTLTGIDLVARANAKALNKQTSASKSASKSLSSLDEIENINRDDGSSSGSDVNQISTPEIAGSSFLDDILGYLKNGEFYNAGKTIAEKINKSLESIDWESIRKKAENCGKNIASFLNGGIENLDWGLLGSTLANGINTAINFAYGFVTTFNWAAFGLGIANSVNGFFSTIDWSLLGQTISNGIIGVLTSFNEFLSNVNWEQIGEDFKMFLINIDWATIFKELIEAVSNIVGGIDGFLTGIFGEDGATTIEVLAAAITTIAVAISAISTALGIYNAVMAITTAVSTPILSVIMLIIAGLALLAVGIVLVVKNLDKIKSAFSTVGSAISKVWNSVWSGLKNIAKVALNGIISYMNLWIKGLNALLLPVRGLIVGISKAFGKSVSLNSIKIPSIPKLDTGGVLTQKSLVEVAEYPGAKNNPEIISPQSIMRETMLDAFSEILPYLQQNNQTGDIVLNINGKEFARATYDDYKNESSRRNSSTTTIVRS